MISKNNKSEKEAVKRIFGPLFLTHENIDKTRKQISDNAKGDFDFILRTIFAVLVIGLGMLIDSTAVVIGGMLIAPLFWPILGFAMGLIEGKSKLVSNSFLTLLKSIGIIIGIALVIGLVVPDQILEAEIFISHTSPTIFDLFIGFAVGFLGAFIVSHPKISSTFAGVAVAAAIVPPMTVVGISLAKGRFDLFGSSLLLTLASLIAITFSSTILFFVSKLRQQSYKALLIKRKEDFGWFLVLLIIIVVPLIILTNQIVTNTKRQNTVDSIVENRLSDATITESAVTEQNEILNIEVTLRRGQDTNQNEIDDIANSLAGEFKQSVIFNIRTIPVSEKTEIVNYK